jgi:multidrug resistance efflux pump
VETAKTRKEFALSRYEEAKRIHAEGLSKAKATLAKGSERLKYAGGYLENARLLFAEKLISKQEMEKAQEEVAVRNKELEHADADMRMVLADDLAEVRRAIAVAEKEHEPISGVVTTPKLRERIGQLVPKGDLIATVHDLTTVTAEIVSPEKEIADVKVGQRVVLKARAYPGESFEGKVTAIAPIATKEEQGLGERNVLVSCQIDNRFLLLKPEMSGRAKIYCGQRQIIDVLTRRIARYVRIEFWSWW